MNEEEVQDWISDILVEFTKKNMPYLPGSVLSSGALTPYCMQFNIPGTSPLIIGEEKIRISVGGHMTTVTLVRREYSVTFPNGHHGRMQAGVQQVVYIFHTTAPA